MTNSNSYTPYHIKAWYFPQHFPAAPCSRAYTMSAVQWPEGHHKVERQTPYRSTRSRVITSASQSSHHMAYSLILIAFNGYCRCRLSASPATRSRGHAGERLPRGLLRMCWFFTAHYTEVPHSLHSRNSAVYCFRRANAAPCLSNRAQFAKLY